MPPMIIFHFLRSKNELHYKLHALPHTYKLGTKTKRHPKADAPAETARHGLSRRRTAQSGPVSIRQPNGI